MSLLFNCLASFTSATRSSVSSSSAKGLDTQAGLLHQTRKQKHRSATRSNPDTTHSVQNKLKPENNVKTTSPNETSRLTTVAQLIQDHYQLMQNYCTTYLTYCCAVNAKYLSDPLLWSYCKTTALPLWPTAVQLMQNYRTTSPLTYCCAVNAKLLRYLLSGLLLNEKLLPLWPTAVQLMKNYCTASSVTYCCTVNAKLLHYLLWPIAVQLFQTYYLSDPLLCS